MKRAVHHQIQTRRPLASSAAQAVRARRRANISWRRLEPNTHGRDKDLASRVSELGVPMTQKEMEALATATRSHRHPRADGGSRREFRKLVRSRVEAEAERQALAEIILSADERTPAQQSLRAFDFIGTALFAVSGTLIAGETGMHVVGAAIVGSMSSMGGGTLLNVVMGTTAGGVYWIRDTRFLLVAVVASVLTFYSWPWIELELARREMNFDDFLPPESHQKITFPQFELALTKNPAFDQRLRTAVAKELSLDANDLSPREIFLWLDTEASGYLDRDELLVLARRQADESVLVFAVESVALGAFAVSGAQSAVVRGLHPVACTAAGVIIVSGGIIRDVVCRRESVALSVESFALATCIGSGTYVFLRHLLVTYKLPLTLGFRVVAAASMTILLRALHWANKPDALLSPMANYRDNSDARLRRSLQTNTALP